MGYVFISYSTKNQMYADAMKNLLNQNGIDTWMAPGDIPKGGEYSELIPDAISNSSCFLVLISNDAQESIWVHRETLRAVNCLIPLFPVKIENVTLNGRFDFLVGLNQITALPKIDEGSEELKRLIEGLKACTSEEVQDSPNKSVKKANSEINTDVADFANLKQMAENGDSDAMCKLAEEYGKKTDEHPRDVKLMFEWYKRAAREENVKGMVELGKCYEKHIGCEIDYKEAVRWYERAALYDDTRAFVCLGNIYENVERFCNLDRAREYYRKAALGGNVLGIRYLELLNDKCLPDEEKEDALVEIFNMYKKAADAGNVSALTYLAKCYELGVGCEINENEALNLYKKAYAAGDTYVVDNIFACYRDGVGCEKSDEMAITFLINEAKANNACAMWTLGSCYKNGRGCEKNLKKAIEWYQKAAELNSGYMTMLGNLYMYGNIPEKNMDKGFVCYKKAADRGNVNALYLIGDCYHYGYGCDVDYLKAIDYYFQYIDYGRDEKFYSWNNINEEKVSSEIIQIGNDFEEGYDCEKNPEIARMCYRKAQDAGNEDAPYQY